MFLLCWSACGSFQYSARCCCQFPLELLRLWIRPCLLLNAWAPQVSKTLFCSSWLQIAESVICLCLYAKERESSGEALAIVLVLSLTSSRCNLSFHFYGVIKKEGYSFSGGLMAGSLVSGLAVFMKLFRYGYRLIKETLTVFASILVLFLQQD